MPPCVSRPLLPNPFTTHARALCDNAGDEQQTEVTFADYAFAYYAKQQRSGFYY
jgi:hypothetical protein